ncbi:hypothetical protein ACLOBS_02015, partial [Limosilactobacillus mucosae]|uniref:hypothetical protein n=1 Tax=Limosilactobacillus mucosae TaxID=97478 RepID=UPI003EBAD9EE
ICRFGLHLHSNDSLCEIIFTLDRWFIISTLLNKIPIVKSLKFIKLNDQATNKSVSPFQNDEALFS